MAYMREDGTKKLLIVANYQKESQAFSFEGRLEKVVLSNDEKVKISENEIELSGYQAVILEII
jgi:oligo-1,6-glucosidase